MLETYLLSEPSYTKNKRKMVVRTLAYTPDFVLKKVNELFPLKEPLTNLYSCKGC